MGQGMTVQSQTLDTEDLLPTELIFLVSKATWQQLNAEQNNTERQK